MLQNSLELLVLIIMLGSVLSLFATSGAGQQQAAPEAINRNSGLLQIMIDPRLELLAVIQYMSGSKMVYRSGPYAEAMQTWFSAYQDHPLMQRLRDMEEYGYTYDLPVSSFLRFEDCSLQQTRLNWEPTMEAMNQQRLENITQAGALDEFYDMVHQFAVQSDFAGFFVSQRDYFLNRVDEVANALNQHPDMIAHMVAWYGYSHASYNLIISPLVNGGYGPALVDAEGKIHAYCVTNIDCSDLSDSKLREVSLWFFHEFSHSFVNPLVDQYWDIFASGEHIYELLQDKIDQAYNSWWVVVAEHLVRVNQHRLSELYSNTEEGIALQSEIDSGFIFIRAAYEAILQFEQEHQEKGIDYASYFPTIAQYFMARTEISEAELSRLQRFTGPINNVFSGDILIIYPDPDRISGVRENIIPMVDWLVVNKGFEAATDQEALKTDLSNKSLVIFGAWGTNLILEKYRQDMPFEIHPDRIIADKTYKGTNLRIALCLPNPLNPKLGMCIYTAQNTEAMKESSSIFHGPEDWYISNSELEVLGSGRFNDKDERWRF